MPKFEPTLRLHIWLETEEGMLLGLGRAQLLSAVREYGSLNKAAKALGMSYRAAWGRIKKTEETLGASLVSNVGERKSFSLTPLGLEILETFEHWMRDVEAYALARGRELFQWDIKEFTEHRPALTAPPKKEEP